MIILLSFRNQSLKHLVIDGFALTQAHSAAFPKANDP